MFKKTIVALGMSLVMILSFVTPVAAATHDQHSTDEYIIGPQYVNINRASCSLTISSGTANIIGSVQKTPSGKDIYLSCTLQKYSNGSWSNIKTWSDSSSTSSSVYISETYSVSKGQYRVQAYYSVSGSGVTESDTMYSKTVTYN